MRTLFICFHIKNGTIIIKIYDVYTFIYKHTDILTPTYTHDFKIKACAGGVGS